MKWISVKESLPLANQPVWIYWRDREVLIGWRTYHGREAVECDPAEGWYSWEYDKCRYANWWMHIENRPDKPESDSSHYFPASNSSQLPNW